MTNKKKQKRKVKIMFVKAKRGRQKCHILYSTRVNKNKKIIIDEDWTSCGHCCSFNEITKREFLMNSCRTCRTIYEHFYENENWEIIESKSQPWANDYINFCPNCKSKMDRDDRYPVPIHKCKECKNKWEIYCMGDE